MKNEVTLFGISFEGNKAYEVVDKDTIYSTPAEKKLGVFKAPNEEVGESRSIGYQASITGQKNPDGSVMGIFLTGFTEACPVWKSFGLTASQVKEKVAYIKKNIVKPYVDRFGTDLSANNIEFWRSYRYRISNGDTFKMDNPEHKMALYFALLNGKVATDENIKNPLMHECPYRLRSFDQNYDASEDFIMKKEEARDYITKLIQEDFAYAVDIMKHLGKYDSSIACDDKYIKRIAVKIFEGMDSSVPVERFVELLNTTAQTAEGRTAIETSGVIKDLLSFNILQRSVNGFMYQNQLIGSTMQEMVYKLSGKDSKFDAHTLNELLTSCQEERLKRNKKNPQTL